MHNGLLTDQTESLPDVKMAARMTPGKATPPATSTTLSCSSSNHHSMAVSLKIRWETGHHLKLARVDDRLLLLSSRSIRHFLLQLSMIQSAAAWPASPGTAPLTAI